MGASRSERMGNRTGLGGLIDRLRFHEASRQGLGLLLVQPVLSIRTVNWRRQEPIPWSGTRCISVTF
jgi:hypothetical protein